MSTLIMSQCWPLQMPPTAKAVLVSLADNANDQGYCWPSIPTISERTCFGERAIQGAIKWLEQHGAIRADRSNGRHTTYFVTPKNYQQPPQEMRRLTAEESLDTPAADAPPHEMPPAANAPTPAADAPQPPQQMRQPPQQVPSNRKEPSYEPSKNRHIDDEPADIKFNFQSEILRMGANRQHLTDWMKVRKAKKAPSTQSALDGFVREARKAGLSIADAVQTCAERGWLQVRAEYLQSKPTVANAPRSKSPEQLAADNEEAKRLLFGKKQSEVIDV